ncbi:MAG: protein kinase [Clostridiales bacterium]|nr:protein kinase [Clostridiales bacterium]
MRDPNRLCPGCMSEWGNPGAPCPVCGFIEHQYERPARWLPLRHILNGKYMVGKVIGEGGFGITYMCWDLNLEVRVAIKEYFPVGLATREGGIKAGASISALPGVRQENYRQGLEKFMTEAKNLSRFYHLKGIVAVKDFFFENETAYMVMEYIDGITLGTYLKQHGGQITEQQALTLFAPVMESLQTVHKSGIIHRDISPDNIMMTKDGRMKLIDFGAARFAGNDMERSLTIILKHGYAPAEQYQSHGNQGPWTDVYAICATMYRMITGQVPPGAMDRLHEDTLKDFKEMGCRVSEKTAYAIIDHGMALKAEDRCQSMGELIEELYGNTGKKVHRKRCGANADSGQKKLLIGAAAAVCVIGAALLLVLGGRSKTTASVGGSMADGAEEKAGVHAFSGDGAVGGSGSGNPQTAAKELLPVTEEELRLFQEAAFEEKKTLSANGYHLLSLSHEGTVTGIGVNESGELDTSKWKDIRAVVSGPRHTVGICADGTAIAAGDTSGGKCAVDMWKELVQVAAGDSHTVGVKEDGTVLAAGANSEGQCAVSSWSEITQAAAGTAHTLGLCSDGTAMAVGDNADGQCAVEEWEDLVAVFARGNVSVGLKTDGSVMLAGAAEGLKEALTWEQVTDLAVGDGYLAGVLSNGTVVTAGDLPGAETVGSWDDIVCLAAADETLFGKKSDGSIVRTSYTYGTAGKEDFTDLKAAVCGGGYLLGLKNDGTVVSYGVSGEDVGLAQIAEWSEITDIAANAAGAMGLKKDGSVVTVGEIYEGVSSWRGIQAIDMSEGIALGLRDDGTVVAAGPEAEKYNLSEITDILSASAASTHLVLVMSDGTVSVRGSSSGSYANTYSWREITQAAAGAQHTVGLKADGSVLATGSGSNGQCDVADWSDVVRVSAGDYVTIGVDAGGTMLVAGTLPGEF